MKLKQLLAALLCAVLVVCCAPIALAAPDTATVTFWFSNGTEMQTCFDLTVSDGTAESYGYTVSEADHSGAAIETVTAMDVLVAAHKAVYGDAFTKETANDFLSVSLSIYGGYMTKVFGISTTYLSFVINDATPHDDTYVDAYFGYTGYAIDTARVHDGDRICLFTIKDAGYSDILPLFDRTTVEAAAHRTFTVSVSGYSVVTCGCSTQDVIDQNIKPLSGATVKYTQDFETFTPVGTLDGSGKVSVKLPKAGTYYLVVSGMSGSGAEAVPVIANFCKVIAAETTPTDPKLSLASAPDKTTYIAGETLDTAGLALLYTDEYGEEETVTEGFVCDPQTLSETDTGWQTVTVTYKGLSVTFDVAVDPDLSNAKFFPFRLRPVFRFADDTLTIGLSVTFRDLNRKAPDMTKNYVISISLQRLLRLFKK